VAVALIPGHRAAPDNSKECLALLRKLLSNIGAPEEVESAFQFIESGNMASLRKLVALLTEESPPEPVPQLTPGQLRAQKMREAKAAKKAQLQPA